LQNTEVNIGITTITHSTDRKGNRKGNQPQQGCLNQRASTLHCNF